MNKQINGLIIEIFFFSLIVIGYILTFPNLKEDNLKKTEAILAYSNKLTINTLEENNYDLFPMTDEYAINNLKVNTLKIDNVSSKGVNCELLLKVSKNSTLDIGNLKIKIDDKIDYISNAFSYEDGEYYYYLLNTKMIDGNDYNIVSYIIWLSSDTKNVNGSLTYAFEVIEI